MRTADFSYNQTTMKKLSTAPYKGVRDFYPEDMAVQQYIFDIWSQTAESFGFERYDASVLEPAELYKAKGAENEEMVNEQTYTFTDRGDREVTLRPEMTPTVARMIAGRRKTLSFPVRWYSIPNLFRYERSQRGRLREHWQLNCDIFGSNDIAADIEIIALAYQTFLNFGADPSMFEIRLNDRAWLNKVFAEAGFDEEKTRAMFALLDRKEKIDNFEEEMSRIAGPDFKLPENPDPDSDVAKVLTGLKELGIENVSFSPSIVRGFDYYTGVVFEFFDTNTENSRSLLGGGRYDNLTALFDNEPIPGVGFGYGDVTMRDFLESHNLLTANITSPDLVVMPLEEKFNLDAERLAQEFRANDLKVSVDFSDRKVGKKLSTAGEQMVSYALVLGEEEVASQNYTVKNLADGTEESGTLPQLLEKLSS